MKLKYAIVLVPLVGIIALAALFGKLGVRPRAIPIIQPSGFDTPSELGFWVYRQSRQKLFRNSIVFFGIDPARPETAEILKGYLGDAQTEGPSFDVVASSQDWKAKNLEQIRLSNKVTAEELNAQLEAPIKQGKRILVVLSNTQTAKLLKNSYARKFEYEFGKKLAAFSTLVQTEDDLKNISETELCEKADRMTLENPESLRCLLKPYQSKFNRQLEKTNKIWAGAADQFGLDDNLIYLYRR